MCNSLPMPVQSIPSYCIQVPCCPPFWQLQCGLGDSVFNAVCCAMKITVAESPWCNPTGWLGLKHQFSYLLLLKVILKVILTWSCECSKHFAVAAVFWLETVRDRMLPWLMASDHKADTFRSWPFLTTFIRTGISLVDIVCYTWHNLTRFVCTVQGWCHRIRQ